MDKTMVIPPEMISIQEAVDTGKNLLVYKASIMYPYKPIYVGVDGGGQEEDKRYLENKVLQSRIPRGLFFIYLMNGESVDKLLKVTLGMSETGFGPKVMLPGFAVEDFVSATGVDIYEKLNGKFAQLSFFMDPRHGLMVILSSKTVPVVFPLTILDAAASGSAYEPPASGLLGKMFQALGRMWQTIPAAGRIAIIRASLDSNVTYFMEHCDGLHIVSLPYGEQPNLVITMVLEVAQSLDTSSSRVLRNIGDMHFTDWLRDVCHVPPENIVAYKQVDIETWNKETVHRFGTSNIFSKPGKSGLENGTAGYVVHFTMEKDGEIRPMAILKAKNHAYVIMRWARE